MTSNIANDRVQSALLVFVLESMTLAKLRKLAHSFGIGDAATAKKSDLVDAIASVSGGGGVASMIDPTLVDCIDSPMTAVRARASVANVPLKSGVVEKSKSRLCQELEGGGLVVAGTSGIGLQAASVARGVSRASATAREAAVRCINTPKKRLLAQVDKAGIGDIVDARAYDLGFGSREELPRVEICKLLQPHNEYECADDVPQQIRANAHRLGIDTRRKSKQQICDEMAYGGAAAAAEDVTEMAREVGGGGGGGAAATIDFGHDVVSCIETGDVARLRRAAKKHGYIGVDNMNAVQICRLLHRSNASEDLIQVLANVSVKALRAMVHDVGIKSGKKTKRQLIDVILVMSPNRYATAKCLNASANRIARRAAKAGVDVSHLAGERANECFEILNAEHTPMEMYCDDQTVDGMRRYYANDERLNPNSSKADMCAQVGLASVDERTQFLRNCANKSRRRIKELARSKGLVPRATLEQTCSDITLAMTNACACGELIPYDKRTCGALCPATASQQTHLCDCGMEIPFESQTCGPYCTASMAPLVPTTPATKRKLSAAQAAAVKRAKRYAAAVTAAGARKKSPAQVVAAQLARVARSRAARATASNVARTLAESTFVPANWRTYVWNMTRSGNPSLDPEELAAVDIDDITVASMIEDAKTMLGIKAVGTTKEEVARDVYAQLANEPKNLGNNEEWRQLAYNLSQSFDDMRTSELVDAMKQSGAFTDVMRPATRARISSAADDYLEGVDVRNETMESVLAQLFAVLHPVPHSARGPAILGAARSGDETLDAQGYPIALVTRWTRIIRQSLTSLGVFVEAWQLEANPAGYMDQQNLDQLPALETAIKRACRSLARASISAQEALETLANPPVETHVLLRALVGVYGDLAILKHNVWPPGALAGDEIRNLAISSFAAHLRVQLTRGDVKIAARYAIMERFNKRPEPADTVPPNAERYATYDDIVATMYAYNPIGVPSYRDRATVHFNVGFVNAVDSLDKALIAANVPDLQRDNLLAPLTASKLSAEPAIVDEIIRLMKDPSQTVIDADHRPESIAHAKAYVLVADHVKNDAALQPYEAAFLKIEDDKNGPFERLTMHGSLAVAAAQIAKKALRAISTDDDARLTAHGELLDKIQDAMLTSAFEENANEAYADLVRSNTHVVVIPFQLAYRHLLLFCSRNKANVEGDFCDDLAFELYAQYRKKVPDSAYNDTPGLPFLLFADNSRITAVDSVTRPGNAAPSMAYSQLHEVPPPTPPIQQTTGTAVVSTAAAVAATPVVLAAAAAPVALAVTSLQPAATTTATTTIATSAPQPAPRGIRTSAASSAQPPALVASTSTTTALTARQRIMAAGVAPQALPKAPRVVQARAWAQPGVQGAGARAPRIVNPVALARPPLASVRAPPMASTSGSAATGSQLLTAQLFAAMRQPTVTTAQQGAAALARSRGLFRR